jgi:hypothetical protein
MCIGLVVCVGAQRGVVGCVFKSHLWQFFNFILRDAFIHVVIINIAGSLKGLVLNFISQFYYCFIIITICKSFLNLCKKKSFLIDYFICRLNISFICYLSLNFLVIISTSIFTIWNIWNSFFKKIVFFLFGVSK